jgi:hypothetical protein
MSETLNVNVLVAAKEEYTKQLVYLLSPEIYKVMLDVYKESQMMPKKLGVSLKNFQILLKQIPVWNTIIIERNTKDIKDKIPYLLDLITAIFVSHVKILACVRLKTDNKSVDVKVPNLDLFLHKIIITISEKIYYNPNIILNKKEHVIQIISDTIEQSIRNQIPIEKILSEYLSGVFEKDKTISTSEIEEELEDSNDEDLEDLEDLEESEESEDLEENIPKNVVTSREIPEIMRNDQNLQTTENLPTKEINQIQDDDEDDEDDEDEDEDLIDKKDLKLDKMVGPIEQIKNDKKVFFSDSVGKNNEETDYETDDD